jgi:CRISPR/Cas system-associated exonuclease Cas4 (RecB family)
MDKFFKKFSYTKLNTLQKCPYKFYLKYVRGILIEIENAKRDFGVLYHSLIEDVLSDKITITDAVNRLSEKTQLFFDLDIFAYTKNAQKILENLKTFVEFKKALGYQVFLEKEVNKECGNIHFNGKLDLVLVKGNTCEVYDFKTTKSKSKEKTSQYYKEQLDFYNFLLNWKVTKAGIIYLDSNNLNVVNVSLDNKNYVDIINNLKNNFKTHQDFKRRKSYLCNFCEYKNICENNEFALDKLAEVK